MNELGRARRLARFGKPNGRSQFVLPVSHGMLMGRLDGLDGVDQRRQLVGAAIDAGVTGFILSPGEMNEVADELSAPGAPGVWLTSGWTNLWRSPEATPPGYGYELGTYRNIVDPQTAAALGADGCHVYLLLGADDPEIESADVERVARYVQSAHECGMPVLVEGLARGPKIDGDERVPGNVAMAARMGYELGADVLKIEYPGSREALESIVQDVGVPVLVLGGSAKSFDAIAEEARAVVDAGALGICYGRNVFQADDPKDAIRSLVEIVNS